MLTKRPASVKVHTRLSHKSREKGAQQHAHKPQAHGFHVRELRDGPPGSPTLLVSYWPTEYESRATAVCEARKGGGSVEAGARVQWHDEALPSDSRAAWFLAWELTNGAGLISRAVLDGRLKRARYHAPEYKLGKRTREIEGVLWAEVVYCGADGWRGRSQYAPVPLFDTELQASAKDLDGRSHARPRALDTFNDLRDPQFKELCNADLARHAQTLGETRSGGLRALVLDGHNGASCRALRAAGLASRSAVSIDVPNFCADVCDALERQRLPGVQVHRRSLQQLLETTDRQKRWDVVYLDFCDMLTSNLRGLRLLMPLLDERPGTLLAVTLFCGRGALERLTYYAGDSETTRAVYGAELAALLVREGWRASLLDYRPSGNMCFWLFRVYGRANVLSSE